MRPIFEAIAKVKLIYNIRARNKIKRLMGRVERGEEGRDSEGDSRRALRKQRTRAEPLSLIYH